MNYTYYSSKLKASSPSFTASYTPSLADFSSKEPVKQLLSTLFYWPSCKYSKNFIFWDPVLSTLFTSSL